MTTIFNHYKSFIPILCSSLLITGCGNGGNNVIPSIGPNSTVNTNVVPSPQILLTELPEMRQVIHFEKHSYILSINEQFLLDPLAIRLRHHPDSFLVVVGHSDESTNEDDNIILSYERAFSVAIYISSVFGIEEERIQIVAAGSSERLSTGKSEKEQQRNRRVEVLSPRAIVRTLSATQDLKY